jgi:hypothetical protein
MLIDFSSGRGSFQRQHPPADVGERQAPAAKPVQGCHRAGGDDRGVQTAGLFFGASAHHGYLSVEPE